MTCKECKRPFKIDEAAAQFESSNGDLRYGLSYDDWFGGDEICGDCATKRIEQDHRRDRAEREARQKELLEDDGWPIDPGHGPG
jgi:hypothetical protein